jgi:hypothetical protein
VVSFLSYHDVQGDAPERVYQAFVLGLLVQLQSKYSIRSNREAGYGRYDVLMSPKDKTQQGYIFEFKKIDRDEKETPTTALDHALTQVQQEEYATELRNEGIQNIAIVAIVVDKKKLWMKWILP